jgi:hypothetical protein
VLRASLIASSLLAMVACGSAEPDVGAPASSDYTEATPPTTLGAEASAPSSPSETDAPDAGTGGDGAVEASIPPVPWSCTGSYGTTKASDGQYYITAFGCWKDAQGGLHGDSGDNCIPSCFAQAKAAGVCLPGETGKQCEERVTWFTADAARFGCLAKLKVTNPANGKSVVAIALDFGPSCTAVENKVKKGVLDASGRVDRELFGADQGFADHALVHVTEVAASTPLGPTP